MSSLPIFVNKEDLNKNDVIYGRGKVHYGGPGNIKLRDIVTRWLDSSYEAESKPRQKEIRFSVFNEIASSEPPGRFLKKDSESGVLWVELSYAEAMTKIVHLFNNMKHTRKLEMEKAKNPETEDARKKVKKDTDLQWGQLDESQKNALLSILDVVHRVEASSTKKFHSKPKMVEEVLIDDGMTVAISKLLRYGKQDSDNDDDDDWQIFGNEHDEKMESGTHNDAKSGLTTASSMLNIRFLSTFEFAEKEQVKSDRQYCGSTLPGGTPYGLGYMEYKDGRRAIGEFKDGVLDGQVIIRYKNGDLFSGQCTKNKRNGFGTFLYKNAGAKYIGYFENDKRHGPNGLYIDTNGQTYEGVFEQGQFQEGKYQFGDIVKIGKFRTGRGSENKWVLEESAGDFNHLPASGFEQPMVLTDTRPNDELIQATAVAVDGLESTRSGVAESDIRSIDLDGLSFQEKDINFVSKEAAFQDLVFPDAFLSQKDEEDFPLHGTVKYGRKEDIEDELKTTDESARNKLDSQNRTAIDLAALTGQMEAYNLLRENKCTHHLKAKSTMREMCRQRASRMGEYLKQVREAARLG